MNEMTFFFLLSVLHASHYFSDTMDTDRGSWKVERASSTCSCYTRGLHRAVARVCPVAHQTMPRWLLLGLTFALCVGFVSASARRFVRIQGQRFVDAGTNAPVVLGGPNVVVKGPPWLPAVSGTKICNDVVNSACTAAGNCSTCSTFNQADVNHIKSVGWNFIRLGVVWAGAQPRDENTLDPDFLRRLHAILNLTDANNINVMLDNHGDMVGTAGCGNGMPMWFQKKAAPSFIGKPLVTGFPYDLVPSLSIKKTSGYNVCGDNATKWAAFAGDPYYNLKNDCCKAINDGGNPGAVGFTKISQASMDYMVQDGPGRKDFVRFWTLMAEAVKDHPSAVAMELMNEPMTIKRKDMFDTWKATAEAITAVIPDISVNICDIGEASLLPAWVTKLTGGAEFISKETIEWIKASNNVFYSWHYGTVPSNIKNMQEISQKWNVPTFGTELGCDQFKAAKAANISHSYWHYSAYCNTGPAFGNRKAPEDTFGACILGWASGGSSKCL